MLVALLATGVRAQDLTLSVDVSDGCIDASSLRERVQHYRAGSALPEPRHVRVARSDGALSFVVLRGDQAVARRRFAQLSAACDEQRDALALAIAVALSHVTQAIASSPAPTDPAASPTDAPPATRPDRAAPVPRAAGRRARQVAAHPEVATIARPEVAPPAHEQAPEREKADVSPPEPAHSRDAHDVSDELTPLPAEHHRNANQVLAASGQARAPNPDTKRASMGSTQERDQPSSSELATTGQLHAGALRLAAGGRYGLQLLPDPLLLFDVGIELGLARSFSLQAAGFASPLTQGAADGGRMRAQVTGGELLLCAHPYLTQVLLRTSVGAAAARVAVRGEDFLVDRAARLTWLAGLLRAAIRWPADAWIAAELALGVHANLIRPRMQVLGASSPDRVSALFGASVGLQLVVSL